MHGYRVPTAVTKERTGWNDGGKVGLPNKRWTRMDRHTAGERGEERGGIKEGQKWNMMPEEDTWRRTKQMWSWAQMEGEMKDRQIKKKHCRAMSAVRGQIERDADDGGMDNGWEKGWMRSVGGELLDAESDGQKGANLTGLVEVLYVCVRISLKLHRLTVNSLIGQFGCVIRATWTHRGRSKLWWLTASQAAHHCTSWVRLSPF